MGKPADGDRRMTPIPSSFVDSIQRVERRRLELAAEISRARNKRKRLEGILMRFSVLLVAVVLSYCVWVIVDPRSPADRIRQQYQARFESNPARKAEIRAGMRRELSTLDEHRSVRETEVRRALGDPSAGYPKAAR
jgi:hypothetical protein